MKHILSFVMYFALVAMLATGCSGAAGTPSPTKEAYGPVIDPANFVTAIDNPYLPLTPGTVFIYEGKTDTGNEHIEVEVTSDTKVIQGVTCVVVRDTVTVDGAMEEQTFDWYAQDNAGNVWYFGEDSKSYENGKFVSTEGSWEAGVDGALPGIVMQANPTIGDIYRQEYYKGEAEDMAEVLSLTETASVPYGSYTDLLMTKEWSPLEPSVIENKYYAPGLGLVLEANAQGGSGKIELISVATGQ